MATETRIVDRTRPQLVGTSFRVRVGAPWSLEAFVQFDSSVPSSTTLRPDRVSGSRFRKMEEKEEESAGGRLAIGKGVCRETVPAEASSHRVMAFILTGKPGELIASNGCRHVELSSLLIRLGARLLLIAAVVQFGGNCRCGAESDIPTHAAT